MNKRIDLSNLGGFPLEEDTLDFMQQSYRSAFAAIAQLCGSKTILYGVEVIAGNVTNGWISYNGELIPFIGGAVATDVVIIETPAVTQATFEDGSIRDVYFTKIATIGITGDFPFADLVPLLSFQNTWLPNDLKQKYCDAAYIAANFDGSGYGINKEKGWRILSSAVPDAAGKVLVNMDTADSELDEAGKIAGSKTGTLVQNQLPASMTFTVPFVAHTASGVINGVTDGPAAGTGSTALTLTNAGGGQSHSRMQPSFVVLTLIKL